MTISERDQSVYAQRRKQAELSRIFSLLTAGLLLAVVAGLGALLSPGERPSQSEKRSQPTRVEAKLPAETTVK